MKRALVVIDMIEDFAHEGGALYCGPSMARIIPVIQREIERARGAGEPIVYLADAHLPDDAEFVLVLGVGGQLVATSSNVDPEGDACGYLRAAYDEAKVNTVENN